MTRELIIKLAKAVTNNPAISNAKKTDGKITKSVWVHSKNGTIFQREQKVNGEDDSKLLKVKLDVDEDGNEEERIIVLEDSW